MRRLFPAAAAALLVALPACDMVKVERTPRGFYTQRDPARIDQQEAASEIRARVRNFAEELGRGNRARAMTAINPTEDVLVIGSDASDGMARIGVRGLAAALDSIAVPAPAVARTPDLRVEVGLREQTGWFSTPIQFMTLGTAAPAQWLRASGVFSQDRGEWKLVQIHLSRAFVPPDTARADSAGADTARGDSVRSRRTPAAPRTTSRSRG
ncbi:MAG TPA: nuclear transport factor 2 family protein [Longimicrobiaceae bacterium]